MAVRAILPLKPRDYAFSQLKSQSVHLHDNETFCSCSLDLTANQLSPIRPCKGGEITQKNICAKTVPPHQTASAKPPQPHGTRVYREFRLEIGNAYCR